jgi:ribose transport system ATP-binding protein
MTTDILTVTGVGKTFPPNVVALEEASLRVAPGEVHCLLGANGAGKSTLLKIIAGALRPSKGELKVAGTPVRLRSPQDGARAGISMIYQELDLVPQLTVEQNLFLGHPPCRFGFVKRGERRRRSVEALRRVGATFSPDDLVESLTLANQQLTAIARSLTMEAKLIIMDEPSASLAEREVEAVFRVVRALVAQGIGILYVSHRMKEIHAIGDRVTVLRGGRTIETFNVADVSEVALVDAVIGQNKSLVERSPRRSKPGSIALDVKSMIGPSGLHIRGLRVRRGEIVGLAGLNGSGRTTFLKALFGDTRFQGEVLLEDQPLQPRHPGEAIRRSIGLVPESRKTEGLVLDAAIYRNATMPWLRRRRFANHRAMKREAASALQSLSTKYASLDTTARQLSGGNQQKIVLAKWIIDGSRMLLLDEPSRGLDVGAKADLYRLVKALAEKNAAVIVASSELEELYAICDRIWVFHEGRNTAEFDPAVTDRDEIERATLLGTKP